VGAGLALLGEFEVVEVDLVLEVLDVAFLLLDVFAHRGQADLLRALDFLRLVFLLGLHFLLRAGLLLVTLAQLLAIE